MIIPLGSRVYIRPIEDIGKMRGLIYVPDTARQRCDHGIVFYKGPLVKEIKIGDHVIFHGYTGTRMVIQNEGIWFVMEEEDIEAVVTSEKSPIVFTKNEIEDLIRQACSEAGTRFGNGVLADYVMTKLLDRIEQHFEMEGLMF